MKKGDIVARYISHSEGECLGTFDNFESCKRWIVQQGLETWVIPFPNAGRWEARAKTSFFTQLKGKVNWIVDNEMAIELEGGYHKVVNLDEEKWEVIEEAPVSYQSIVAHMSDEELKASLEALRAQRSMVKPTKRRVKVEGEENELEKVLGSLTPEQMQKLKQKLGLE